MATKAIALIAVFACACGRVSFETFDDTCAPGDGRCLVECVGMDPDCETTCGDGQCVGNAGELCATCPVDCATLDAVCGNGACDAGEAADGCVADCGPDPWPWVADEDDLVLLINQTRTTGYMCTTAVEIQPELALEPTFEPSAREWAWELAHHRYFDPAGGACNGRLVDDREAAGGYAGYLSAQGYTTARDVLTAWLADPAQCAILMSPVPTQVFAAAAHDAGSGYVVVLR